jgi:hypothetical protein
MAVHTPSRVPDRPRLPVAPARAAAGWLTVAALVVTTVGAAVTFAVPSVLRGPAVTNGSARGTALVVLLVGVPLTAVGLLRARAGSDGAVLGWLGGLGYLLYNAMMFVFATPMNALFLVYVASLSLVLWSTVATLVGTDAPRLAGRFTERFPVRGLATYVWVVVALNAFAWLGPILRGLVDGEPAAMLDGTGMTTNPVYVQDLAVWLPLMAVAAWWLWHRRPWGYLVVGAVLVMWVVEALGIAVDQWFGHRADPTSSVASGALVPAFLVLAVIGLVPVAAFVRDLRRTSPTAR